MIEFMEKKWFRTIHSQVENTGFIYTSVIWLEPALHSGKTYVGNTVFVYKFTLLVHFKPQ